MKLLPHLRKFRIVVSAFFFLGITLFYLDILRIFDPRIIDPFTFLQFVPSLLKFISAITLGAAGFIFIIALTLLFGRIYCSTLCPLGFYQDLIIKISGRARRVRYRYGKNHRLIKYSTLSLVSIILAGGSSIGLVLLDPFSNYGRFLSEVIRPIFMGLNNFSVSFLEMFELYYLYPVPLKAFSLVSLVLVFAFFIFLTLLSFYKGRLFCNTLCPVGIFLGLAAKFSLHKIVIDSNSCRSCGVCEFICKANCIDSSKGVIDFERCILCFNCLNVCPDMGVKFSRVSLANNKAAEFSKERRDFFSAIIIYSVMSQKYLTSQKKQGILNLARIPEIKNYPVVPPGGVNLDNFTLFCTACHLCISSCPTQVLQPSFLEYGLLGIQKPTMNYRVSYCNYDCTICGEVCPTGAILPLIIGEKKLTQIGKAVFIKENCIVFNQNTACSACSEHCPTKAVHTVPYKNLLAPEIDNSLCIGCGACEFACPTKPNKAIYVDGNAYHSKARKPPLEEAPVKTGELEDFPF